MHIEKLKKVIEIANKGATDGERGNALRIVERECKERGILVSEAFAGRFGAPSAPMVSIVYGWKGTTGGFDFATAAAQQQNFDAQMQKQNAAAQQQQQTVYSYTFYF